MARLLKGQMNKVALLILCLVLSLAATLGSGQTFSQNKPDAKAPTLEQILDKYVQALGGRAALEKINSRASKGTFTSDHLKTKGPIELYAKVPNKWLMVLLAQGYGNYRRGFNGTVAWEKYPGSESASNLSGYSKRDAEFYLPLKFHETYPNVALKDNGKLGEHETTVLEAPAAGSPKRWFFDNNSGLLLRTETRNSSGKVLDSVDYDDYRMVGGVQEPFSIRLVDRDGTDFNIKLSEVKHNILVDDASFDKPEKQPREASRANTPQAKPEVRLTSGNTKIPYVMDDNGNRLLKVRVNNSPPLNFTIDTGSDVFAILTNRQAQSLGLTSGNNYKVGIAGNVGEIEAATIPSANLTLPGVEALNQRIEVIISDELVDNESKIDGVLGLGFLKKFVVEIDYEAQTLSLFAREKYQYKGAGEVIAIKIKDGAPMVRLKMTTPSGKSFEDNFEVDNGMGRTLVFKTPAVKKYGLLAEMQTIQAPLDIEAGGEYRRRIGRMKNLQLGHFIIENPTVSLSENVEGEGGIIGEEILRRFKVIFDFSHDRMILEPNSHFKDPYAEDMSGMSLTPEKIDGTKLFRIRQVVLNTPASEAGLQAGDLVTAIDGQPATDFTEGHIERMFTQDGREVALTIKRDEKVLQARLKLRRLI
jgi:outer membrane lipoprotein-sorting protein/predicted aspartyl protease